MAYQNILVERLEGKVGLVRLNRPKVLNALNGTQTGALAGFEGFKALARINIIRGALTFPITIVCVVLWQLPGAVCSLVAATAAGCVLNNIAIRRQCRANAVTVSWRGAWSERRILWSFSTPTFLSGVMAGPHFGAWPLSSAWYALAPS